jgi:effector-binding domain-containing protein
MLIKIGDFSKLSFVTIQALRHYDDIGLLKPKKIDQFTGYRYYTADQLVRINYISALKGLGLSLDDIKLVLQDAAGYDQIKNILTLKRSDLLQRLADEQNKLAQVDKLLKRIDEEGKMPRWQTIVKQVEPCILASVRAVVPNYSGQIIAGMFGELIGFINSSGLKFAGPTMMTYNDSDYKEENADIEVSAIVNRIVPGTDRVKVYEQPGVEKAASLTYKGSYEGMGEAYNTVMSWVANNNYRISGVCREIYLVSPADTQDPNEYVSEIQVPIEPAGE